MMNKNDRRIFLRSAVGGLRSIYKGVITGGCPPKGMKMIHEVHEGHKDKDMTSCFFVYFVDF
jgi:hypothetical protein